MFCSNCGRKLPSGVFFCAGCGSRIAHELEEDSFGMIKSYSYGEKVMTRTEGEKRWSLCCSFVISIMVELLWWMPLARFNGETCGIFQIMVCIERITKRLENFEVLIAGIMVWIVLGLYIASIVYTIKAVKLFLDGKRDAHISTELSSAMLFMAIQLIAIFLLGVKSEISLSILGWMVLAMVLVNYFYFIKNYCSVYYVDYKYSRRVAPEERIEDRVCLMCKTSFINGDRCPKCGSKNVSS